MTEKGLIKFLQNPPIWCREPEYRLTMEQIEELEEMLADYRRRIRDEEMCAGSPA